MNDTPYIFILGVSRSGTSLMRKILNKSTQVALCDENYFLGHLIPSEGMRSKFKKFGDRRKDENVRALVDFLYSPGFYQYSRLKTLNWQWRWFVTEVPKDVMLQRMLDSDRSDKALFTLLMDLFAESQGAEVRGEKTPAHIRYVDTIFDWYPQARVIHMMRDPRAIMVSEARRRREKALSLPYKQLRKFGALLDVFLVAQITWTWSDAYRRAQKNMKKYEGKYRLLRFEDLVADPENILKEICEEFGLEFQEKMLAQNVISDGFKSGQSGFDSQAARRWETRIPKWSAWWFRTIFNGQLQEQGYQI